MTYFKMKKLHLIGMTLVMALVVCSCFAISSCEDTIPFRYKPYPPDSLATRQIPHAFFIVNGMVQDSLTQEHIPDLPIALRSEEAVLTNEEGEFSAHTVAFPTSQEFRLLINPYGENHNPMYAPETLYIHFILPTFQLSQDDILEYGSYFFGSTYTTVTKTLTPLVYE